MNEHLLQIILARRNNEAEGWMQILVFIVLAVFWVVGGILKAKANKSQTGDKSNLPCKPVRRPPVHSREAREQMLRQLERPADSAQIQRQQPRPATQKPRMKFADLQAAVRKFATEAEKAFESRTKDPVRKPERSLPVPQIKAERKKFEEPVTPVIKGLQDKRAAKSSQIPESESLSDSLIDYDDPDDLKRAILHYEILGKPVSLRSPSENSVGL